ncbi:glucan endo- -alpha-glucosidase agn1 [Fusarium albosuccineum]|uniref:Glucan endo- -alpha-glucosidase agn1 n=1 Tax=Fusarium albosuccineum TaxID=1237068 RepID=A0A8H4KZV5_9HYPO|nr:glucan endo- -alpha-glucosidase agn1 [Fusarium albosuccineum]
MARLISRYSIWALAAFAFAASQVVNAKSVYCHYMIGTVNEGSGHAELDVDQAQALGFDAFALNIGRPGEPWARTTIRQLFDYADSKDFKLFFSLDFHQTADINEYTQLVSDFINRPSYLTAGPDGHPVISTFSVGSVGPDGFRSWMQDNFNGQVYFLPNADTSPGYNDPDAWFQQWGGVVDGVFGWETAWPAPGNSPANVSDAVDTVVQEAAHGRQKTYMAPLSSLQYKKCCGGHYYRIGEVNLPQRMTQLLSLQPDFVEVLTWNDAGESHYIGNNWAEGLSKEILDYSDTDHWPHFGWQPLIASFIAAYKDGKDAASMAPPNGVQAVGALWYRPIFKTASCQKPGNWQSAIDAVNYAIVIGSDASDLQIRVTSGGQVIGESPAHAGLNYASVPGIRAGPQKVEVVRGSSVVMTAASVVDVAETNADCFFNFHVVGLE